MRRFDFSPLYRSAVGFDRMAERRDRLRTVRNHVKLHGCSKIIQMFGLRSLNRDFLMIAQTPRLLSTT